MILDANIWAAAADLEDPHHASARSLLLRLRDDTWALDLTIYEVLNIALRRWQLAAAASKAARLVTERCAARLIRIDESLGAAAAEIAEQNNLTSYDAAYVAAARASGQILVSLDQKDLVRPGHAVTPEEALGRL
jgi:predicted nucleic acid-binding protein